MADVRSMLRRVARLEAARTPRPTPIVAFYGSFEAFEAEVQRDIDAGKLDGTDMPVVIDCLRRWERNGTYQAWKRTATRWERGLT